MHPILHGGIRVLAAPMVCLTAVGACSDDPIAPEEDGSAAVACVSTSAGVPAGPSGIAGLPPSAFPLAINDRGTVVGWLRGPSGDLRAFSWRAGSVTELPGLGGPTSSAEDVNDSGAVAGHADDAAGRPRAVVWQAGGVQDLGTLGGAFSFATAINDGGDVVGASETADGTVHAFLWSEGRMVDLGRLPGTESSRAEDLNDAQDVVGWSAGGNVPQRATLWRGAAAEDLGTLAHESGAFGINECGHIVGASIRESSAIAVLWEEGRLRPLGTLGGSFSSANAIRGGRVVGASETSDGWQTAFLWEEGTMTSLGRREGALSNAFDLNADGTVVGFSDGPVMWRTGAAPFQGSRPGTRAPAIARTAPSPALVESAEERTGWAARMCRARGSLAGPLRGIDVAAGCH